MSLRQLSHLAHRSTSPIGTFTACRTMSSVASTLAAKLQEGPGLTDFVRASGDPLSAQSPGSRQVDGCREPSGNAPAGPRKLAFIQTMGCQMNVSDSEVVLSILRDAGYDQTDQISGADVVLVNTCAIREGAEQKIWAWLGATRHAMLSGSGGSHQTRWQRQQAHARRPVLGVLGCMAERLKGKMLDKEKLVDLVAGPDAYRDLPRLIAAVQGDEQTGRQSAMNVQLSLEETYADVVPLRPQGSTAAFLSVMRGCNNMCAFCIVPFTRGRERSRPMASILDEVKMLSDSGVKEVTLLGQNVNSYADRSDMAVDGPRRPPLEPAAVYAKGFSSVYRPNRDGAVPFAELLACVAAIDPEIRVRFTSPHPKDFSNEVLQVISENPNVCNQLHMPAQSGASSTLQRMRRGYTREAYDALVSHARRVIPGVALSTDIITGFCGETEKEHAATVDLMRATRFDSAFMFAYSERDKTAAARHLPDDVPEAVKSARLQEIIATYRAGLAESMAAEVGRTHLVLVQGASKRDESSLTGRTDTMKRVVFPDAPMPGAYGGSGACDAAAPLVQAQPGDYVAVEVVAASAGTLTAKPLGRTTLQDFVQLHGSAAPLPASQSDDAAQPLRAVG